MEDATICRHPRGEQWVLTTYEGHDPDDKKIDMLNANGETLGTPVVVSAPGQVREFFDPGGVEIDHGNGWFTVYLHMQNINVEIGQQLAQGEQIGEVGTVGGVEAHLHYEQLYDFNGNGDGSTDEMVYPVIEGQEYRLDPDQEFPVVESTNACDTNPPTKFWVDTFAAATGYPTPTCFSTGEACPPQGTLQEGTHYVFCRAWGSEVRNGDDYNHWWLKTDLDEVAPGGSSPAWVSAYYLSRWGNDEAKDNHGRDIPDC
jgi:Peptidase family M23